MKSEQCPYCGGNAPLLFSTVDHNRKLSSETFDYFRCSTCRFIFLSPVPRDLGRYYTADYYAVPRSEAELKEAATHLQTWKLDQVKSFATSGTLLEIGPAYGLFAYLAKQAGFKVTAIEMDMRCCEFLRSTVGINVVESPDTVARLRELPQFDVIVIWQVLEHLPDPWAVLTAAAERLAPNGVLILDTPNPQSFQFGVLGRYWAHLDAPRHVTLIPAQLIVDHVAKSGLKSVFLTATDRGAIGFNGFGWAFSFKNFFEGRLTGGLAHFLGRVLAKLLIPIERTGWRGSTYTAVFRKEAAQ